MSSKKLKSLKGSTSSSNKHELVTPRREPKLVYNPQ